MKITGLGITSELSPWVGQENSKIQLSPWVGQENSKLNSALGWGRTIIESTKISDMALVQISTADSSTKPSGLPAFGPSWHVSSLGLDRPMIDRGILFLKQIVGNK